jgi:lipopolysaccharide transport system ATP-binding protein
MSESIIRVENLSKRYRIGQREQGYKTFREAIVDVMGSPVRNLRRLRRLTKFDDTNSSGPSLNPILHTEKETEDVIWALNDVSFEIRQGEVAGIIGRNGAGKSTLLKILSRVTEPTTGDVKIYGRISSLLEVGTGFHPELTGRENIFLNGAILGMRKQEIKRKFDEIVAFAETEKFIDTPVKYYSSGMYVRLAFAVAAHLEPDILLVDEVLAVGDVRFQRKCLDKMQDVGQQGRTVLFVSHNMPAVTRLCPRTILLDEGRMLRDGPSHEVVSVYLGSGFGMRAARQWPDSGRAPGNDVVRLRAVRVRMEDGRITDTVDIRKPVGIEMEYEVLSPGSVLIPNYQFYNEEGVCAFVAYDSDPAWRRKPRPVGRYISIAWIPGNFLSEGSLIVRVLINTFHPFGRHFDERDAVAFQVVDTLDGDSARGDFGGTLTGVVRPLLRWTTQFKPNGQVP